MASADHPEPQLDEQNSSIVSLQISQTENLLISGHVYTDLISEVPLINKQSRALWDKTVSFKKIDLLEEINCNSEQHQLIKRRCNAEKEEKDVTIEVIKSVDIEEALNVSQTYASLDTHNILLQENKNYPICSSTGLKVEKHLPRPIDLEAKSLKKLSTEPFPSLGLSSMVEVLSPQHSINNSLPSSTQDLPLSCTKEPINIISTKVEPLSLGTCSTELEKQLFPSSTYTETLNTKLKSMESLSLEAKNKPHSPSVKKEKEPTAREPNMKISELDLPSRDEINKELPEELLQIAHLKDLYEGLYYEAIEEEYKRCNSNDEGLFSFGAGISCYKQEKYKDALDHFQVSKVRMSRCIKSSVFSSVSLCHLYMGDIETALCHYSVAVDHYHEAVHTHQPVCLVEQCFGLDHVTLSGKLRKLAQSLHSAKRIVESEHCYREAISCASDTSPADQLAAYTDLGNLLHSIGDNERAVEAYSAAVGLAEEIGDHVSLAWVHGNLGKTYLSLGKKERGMHHLEKSLDLTYVHDPSPSSISRALSNIGTGYQAIDRLDKAEEYYDQALCQAIYSNDVMGWSHAYGNLGNLYLLRKDQEKAIPHYTEVLRLTNDRGIVLVTYHNRGSAYYELGEKQVESLYITKQRKEFQHIAYGHHTVDFESKHQPIALDQHIVTSFEKGLDDFEKVIKNVEDLFEHVTKSTKHLDMFVSLFDANSKAFARAIDCAYYLKDIYKSLCLAEQCRSRTLGELLLKKSHSPRIPLTAPLSLDQIMSIMKHHEPNVPVVVLCYTGTRLLVWVMVYDGVELHTNMFEQQPSSKLLENMPFDYYLQYSLSNLLTLDVYREDNIPLDNYTLPQTRDKVHAIALLNKLIASPLHSIIKATLQQGSSKKIVLIPDSNTKLVPFSAIGDQGELLGDRYCIQYAPSLLTLGIMLQVPSTTIVVPRDSGDMCVVGDPITPPFKFKGDTWDLGPLPHAKEEAEWVSQFTRASPLVEHDATKEAVLSRLKRAKLIHLATHGSANHTFIVLAGSRYGSQSDDKKLLLHASEVEALSLAPALVILSSCNSGRGIIKGDDTQNIARAFLIAGAQAVLTSIWKVPDQSARYFVQYFYRYMLDGHSSSEALQKATLSLRCFTLFSQHIHWSGYQITGTIIFA